jgi:hypothetical protein
MRIHSKQSTNLQNKKQYSAISTKKSTDINFFTRKEPPIAVFFRRLQEKFEPYSPPPADMCATYANI